MIARLVGAGALLAAAVAPCLAGDTVKIGLITTTTTPSAVIGRDVVDAMNLAIEHVGGTMGGKKIELIIEDDAAKPELGRQKVEKLVRQDNVDFLTGINWSNVLLASRKPIVDSGKIFISANAGPAEMAGKLCAENMFFVRGQNDLGPMGLGELLNQRGVKKIYAIAPNFAAGRDMVAGLERTFKGQIVGRDFTKWGDDPQIDFAAELAKAKASGADGVFSFFPGRTSAAFARQFDQAGLYPAVKLYSVYTLDQLTLPSLQEAGIKAVLGSLMADFYAIDADNPENKRFVADFKAKYNRYPSNYAGAAYDVIPRLKSAVDKVGNATDTAKLRAALKVVDYKSIFGPFKIGRNNFPIQPIYEQTVAPDAAGTWKLTGNNIVLKDTPDPYIDDCKMTD